MSGTFFQKRFLTPFLLPSGTLKYSAIGLPGGLKINPSTGAITGTLAAGDAGDGPYSVTVLAQDGTYSTSQTFNWGEKRCQEPFFRKGS